MTIIEPTRSLSMTKTIFEIKEAIASVALDNDPDIRTVVEGTTNNPKLHGVKIRVWNKHTQRIVWKGSIADVYRDFWHWEYKR